MNAFLQSVRSPDDPRLDEPLDPEIAAQLVAYRDLLRERRRKLLKSTGYRTFAEMDRAMQKILEARR